MVAAVHSITSLALNNIHHQISFVICTSKEHSSQLRIFFCSFVLRLVYLKRTRIQQCAAYHEYRTRLLHVNIALMGYKSWKTLFITNFMHLQFYILDLSNASFAKYFLCYIKMVNLTSRHQYTIHQFIIHRNIILKEITLRVLILFMGNSITPDKDTLQVQIKQTLNIIMFYMYFHNFGHICLYKWVAQRDKIGTGI